MAAELELLITTPPATTPVRASLVRALTTIGSVASADVRVPGVAPHWLVIQRQGDAVEVCELASGERHQLVANQALAIGRSSLLLCAAPGDRPLPVSQIADALTGVDAPDAALRLLLERVMALTGASSGAVVTAERGSYRVAVAIDDRGRPLEGGARLLSDTVVRDALAGQAISAADLRSHARYQSVPSVVDLDLGSVLAVPMVLGDRVLGAIYLGRRGSPARFDEGHARDIEVIASMAIPLVAQLRRRTARPEAIDAGELIGESPPIERLRELVARIGPSDLSVLITGETGTGKEVTARAIHRASRRAGRPMVAINCSAVPAALLEAELFGYRKGAFTGAIADREGRIEAAAGSTLFLDEVGDMALPMQAALLRVLQEREVIRVGENQPRPVDFRLVCATNRDLDAAVAAGEFRSDLLFRIREMPLALPPLRERGADVPLLASLFLRQAENELGLASRPLAPATEQALASHPWPGNVRELRATIRRAAVLATGPAIEPGDLAVPDLGDAAATDRPGGDLGPLDRPLSEARDAYVRRYVRAVIDAHGGNREAAAAALGISLRSLYRYQ